MKVEELSVPPDNLRSPRVVLRFIRMVPGEASRGFVPYYHFRIVTTDDAEIGHINFRVGRTEHVRLCAGHIGFEVLESYRGHGYAWEACQAIAPFVRSIYESVIITCDPDNLPSIRTIERLGARFVDEVAVPPHDPHYLRGSRSKRRYEWRP
jgi:predicted acetyltransferase